MTRKTSSITTKRGDAGQTDLLGARVSKDHVLVHLVGELDELNALLGAVQADLRDRKILLMLRRIQEQLFVLGAEVASIPLPKRANLPHLKEEDLRFLDQVCIELEHDLPALTTFILPGGGVGGAKLHFARAVARRVERTLLVAAKSHVDLKRTLPYLNRLSDLLFLLARAVNKIDQVKEIPWKGTRS